MIRSSTFEVCIEVSGKPEIEGIYPDEATALGRAQDLLKLAKYTAVRVFRVSASDSHTLVFEQFYKGGGSGSVIAGIEQAYVCTAASDVYSFESRQTLLRLLRHYFDQQLTTPLELLHDAMALRLLERDTLLFSQAGHRLAAIQAQQLQVRPADRHEALSRLFREILDLSRESERLLPYAGTLAARGLTALVAQVTAELPPEQQGRVVTFAVARLLREARDWPLKLEAACGLFAEEQSPAAAAWLDGVLAEVVDGNEAIKAVLCYAPNLATALEALLAVIDGSWDSRLPGTRSVQKLSDILDRQPLPRVRAALLGRIASALGGRTPLTRLDRAGNGVALKHLLPKLQQFGGFMGGVAMSEALTRRAKVDFSSGPEDLSFEGTVAALSGFLPGPARKIGYLLDLLSSDLGRRKAHFLTQEIAALFSELRGIRDFAPHVDSSWSQAMVREDFRRRLYQAGIPHRLADGLMRKLDQVKDGPPRAGRMPAATAARPRPTAEPEGEMGGLVLTCRGVRHVVTAEETPFTIGRSPDCGLAVDCAMASRSHAVIEVEGGDFVLVDRSKNGTFVQGADRRTTALSKGSMVLPEQGTITIGVAGDSPEITENAVVGFQRVRTP